MDKAYSVKESCHLNINDEMINKHLLIIIKGYKISKITLMGKTNETEIISTVSIFNDDLLNTVYVPVNKAHLLTSKGGKIVI